MSPEEPSSSTPEDPPEELFTVQDMIAQERRQMRFLLVIFAAALAYVLITGRTPFRSDEPDESRPAPVTSSQE